MCDETKQLLTGEQLAEILQVHPKTIWLMARRGDIPRVVVGRRAVRFSEAAVLTALEEREQERLERRRG